jgi:hypothetical protein
MGANKRDRSSRSHRRDDRDNLVEQEASAVSGIKATIDIGNDSHIVVREFDYDDGDGDPFVATIWLGNENSGQECDVMLTAAELDDLISALKLVRVGIVAK